MPCAEVWRMHPRGTNRFVPAVHVRPDGTASVYMNYASRYDDSWDPDAARVEYRRSVNPLVNCALDRLVGQTVVVYARRPDGYYVADRAEVTSAPSGYVFHIF